MPRVNLSEVESRGNVFISKQAAVLRIVEAEGTKTKAGDPAVILTCEIVKPTHIENGKEKVGVAGLKITHYLSYGPKAASMAKETHRILEIPLDFDTEDSKELNKWKGRAFEAEIWTDPLKSVDEKGNPVIDPTTGQQIERPSYKISMFLRRNKEHEIPMPF